MGIRELGTILVEDHGIEIGMREGIEKGRIEGFKKGRVEEKSSIVPNLLLKSNYSVEEISKFANASIDFVRGIKSELSAAETN